MDKPNASRYDGKTVWIACQAALSFMTLVLIYICLCLIWFVTTSNKPSRTFTAESYRNSKICENSAIGQRVLYSSMAKRRLRIRFLMRFTCLFATIITLMKFLVDQVKFFYAWNAGSDYVCEIVYDITDVAMFYLSYMGVYSFLWLKQWLFYCDPVAAKFLYNRRLVIFSRVFVIFVFIISLGVAAANWVQARYEASPMTDSRGLDLNFSTIGCVTVYDMSDPSVQWPILTYTVLNAVFQITLLSLFIYPLLWDKLYRWKNADKTFSQRGTLEVGSSHVKNFPIPKHSDIDDAKSDFIVGRRHFNMTGLSKRALRSIRRTIFWTTVCILTDASLVAIFAKISIGTPQVLITVAANFDLLVNIICILATYSSRKQILFPMCSKTVMIRDTSSYWRSSEEI